MCPLGPLTCGLHSSLPSFSHSPPSSTLVILTLHIPLIPSLISPDKPQPWLNRRETGYGWKKHVTMLSGLTENHDCKPQKKVPPGNPTRPAVSLLTLLDVFTRSPLSNIKTALSALSADDLASLLRWGKQSGKNIHRSLFQNLVIYLPLDLCALLSLLLAEMIGPAPN